MPFDSLDLKQGSLKLKRDRTGRTAEYELIGRTTEPLSEVSADAMLANDHGLVVGEGHPDDDSLPLVSIETEPYGAAWAAEGATLSSAWLFKLRYSNQPSGGVDPNPNPLDRDPEVRWSGETETRSIFMDFSATPAPIQNSAGEPFDSLPQRDFGELTIHYTRNEASPNFATLYEYMHVVNDSAFTIDGQSIPERFAKVHIEDAPKLVENGVTFYRVTYVVKLRAGGWNPTKVLDVGYSELLPLGRAPIVDDDGTAIRKPWPLDGDGLKTAEPTGPPAELEFQFYEEKDFGVLDFE